MTNRIKRIWRGLVVYANANLQSDSGTLAVLADTILECMPWSTKTATFEYVAELARSYKTEPTGRTADWFREKAIGYQPEIRRLLSWLCDPKQGKDCRPAAFDFLTTHMEHIGFTRADPAFDPTRPESTRYWKSDGEPKDDFPHRTLRYEDLADPICDFILNEHERYHDEEYERARKSKFTGIAPIRFCDRPACDNLFMPERLGRKKYCSDVCRASRDQEERPDFKRCYQCLYRLEGLKKSGKMAVLRKRLKKPTTEKNLHELETRWPEYAERVRKIRGMM